MFTNDDKIKIVAVESWALMRKFIEETVKKMNECRLEKIFSDDKSVEEYIMCNNIALLLIDISAGNEERILTMVKKIKDSKPDIKVILSTLTSSAMLEEKAKNAGADGVWQKEISEKSFENICRSHIGRGVKF